MSDSDPLRSDLLPKQDFVAAHCGVFEHSAWVAERACADCVPEPSLEATHQAMVTAFRSAPETERLAVLKAHPDLAGKLAQAKRLTESSTAEQASAGLDALTDAERQTFEALNSAYVERFGFPFIIAVRDHTKASILQAFEQRLENDGATEFAEASRQVERIAWHRLAAHFNAS